MSNTFITIFFFFIIFIPLIIGYIIPYMQLKKTGASFTKKDFFSRLIVKAVFPNNHNKKIFALLKVISSKNLGITIDELLNIYESGGDVSEYVNAHIISKNKNISISKEDIKILILSDKNIIIILNAKDNNSIINATEELIK